MKFRTNLFFLACISLQSLLFSVKAQDPSKILDTLKLNNKDVVLFSNNQWMYLDEYSILYGEANSDIYSSNWNTNEIYGGYKGPVRPQFDVNTIDVSNYTIPYKGGFLRGYGRGHAGVDIKLRMGDSIVAAFDGKVRYAQYHRSGYGYLVIIRHSNGLETWYSHLSKLTVDVNQFVASGQLIGLGGMTGRATTPHLHLEFRYHDVSMDPKRIIDYPSLSLNATVQKNTLIANNAISTPAESTKTTAAPPVKKPISKYKVHTIKQGDTLYALSRKYNTSVHEICRMNGIRPNSTIQPGMKIKLPRT